MVSLFERGPKTVEVDEAIIKHITDSPEAVAIKIARAGVLARKRFTHHRDFLGIVGKEGLSPKVGQQIALLFQHRDIDPEHLIPIIKNPESDEQVVIASILTITTHEQGAKKLAKVLSKTKQKEVLAAAYVAIQRDHIYTDDGEKHAALCKIRDKKHELGLDSELGVFFDFVNGAVHERDLVQRDMKILELIRKAGLEKLEQVFLMHLALSEKPEVLDLLNDEVRYEDERTFNNAVDALGFIGSQDAIEILSDRFEELTKPRETADATMKEKADMKKAMVIVNGLGKCNGSEAPDILVELLTRDVGRTAATQAKMKQAAAKALVAFDDPVSRHGLIGLADSGTLGHQKALQTLEQRTKRTRLLEKIGMQTIFGSPPKKPEKPKTYDYTDPDSSKKHITRLQTLAGKTDKESLREVERALTTAGAMDVRLAAARILRDNVESEDQESREVLITHGGGKDTRIAIPAVIGAIACESIPEETTTDLFFKLGPRLELNRVIASPAASWAIGSSGFIEIFTIHYIQIERAQVLGELKGQDITREHVPFLLSAVNKPINVCIPAIKLLEDVELTKQELEGLEDRSRITKIVELRTGIIDLIVSKAEQGNNDAIDVLCDIVMDTDQERYLGSRLAAIEALGRLETDTLTERVRVLERAATIPKLRTVAEQALEKHGLLEKPKTRLERFREASDDEEKVGIITEVGARRAEVDEDGRTILREALRDPSVEVKRRALTVVDDNMSTVRSKISSQAVGILRDALEPEQPRSMKTDIAFVLGRHDQNSDALDALIKLADDRSPVVRLAAIAAISRRYYHIGQNVDLEALLDDENVFVRQAAYELYETSSALFSYRYERDTKADKERGESQVIEDVAKAFVGARSRNGMSEALHRIIDAQYIEPKGGVEAIELIGELENPAALDRLNEIMNRFENPELRTAAIISMAKLIPIATEHDKQKHSENLTEIINHEENPRVNGAALAARNMIAEPNNYQDPASIRHLVDAFEKDEGNSTASELIRSRQCARLWMGYYLVPDSRIFRELLITASLQGKTREVRLEAVNVMREINESDSITMLHRAATVSSCEDTRVTAVQALGTKLELNHNETLHNLIKISSSTDIPGAVAAVAELEKIDDSEARKALEYASEHHLRDEVKQAAKRALGHEEPEQGPDFEDPGKVAENIELIRSISGREDSNSLDTLEQAIDEDNPEQVRIAAAEVLGETRSEHACNRLLDAYNKVSRDSYYQLAEVAILTAIARHSSYGNEQALEYLADLLSDEVVLGKSLIIATKGVSDFPDSEKLRRLPNITETLTKIHKDPERCMPTDAMEAAGLALTKHGLLEEENEMEAAAQRFEEMGRQIEEKVPGLADKGPTEKSEPTKPKAREYEQLPAQVGQCTTDELVGYFDSVEPRIQRAILERLGGSSMAAEQHDKMSMVFESGLQEYAPEPDDDPNVQETKRKELAAVQIATAQAIGKRTIPRKELPTVTRLLTATMSTSENMDVVTETVRTIGIVGDEDCMQGILGAVANAERVDGMTIDMGHPVLRAAEIAISSIIKRSDKEASELKIILSAAKRGSEESYWKGDLIKQARTAVNRKESKGRPKKKETPKKRKRRGGNSGDQTEKPVALSGLSGTEQTIAWLNTLPKKQGKKKKRKRKAR